MKEGSINFDHATDYQCRHGGCTRHRTTYLYFLFFFSEFTRPYYTIYCNLSSGEYIRNTDAYQILGIVQKRFIAGDYIHDDGG